MSCLPKKVYMRADQIQSFREMNKNTQAVFIYKTAWRDPDNHNRGGNNFQFSLEDAHAAVASYLANDGEWQFVAG